MKSLLRNIVALLMDGGPSADDPAEQEEIDRLVQEVYGLTAAEVATVESVGPS